ncbi:MAG: hypothetical protein R3B13_23350 [Polyangiaceae bacterium]
MRDGTTYVDFRAGRVDVDVGMSTLELHEDVEICVDRYRLRSQHLRLKRGPRGVETEGPGRVSFCPCPDSPVQFGFSSALVAPPTDLLIEDPTLYVGGVPVFYLPVLWLRSRERLGLLPPTVAWRGDDGLFAGAGVHVPLGKRVVTDVRAGGYVRGGVDIEATLASESTTTRFGWDHLQQSVLKLDAIGHADAKPTGAVTWRADLARGTRARRSIPALAPAAQRFDRVELEAQAATGALALGLGGSSVSPRGAALEDPWSVGPTAYAAIHAAPAPVVSAALESRAWSLDDGTQATSLVLQRGELVLAGPVGPVEATIGLGQGALSEQRERDGGRAGWLSGKGRVALPLERHWTASGWTHRVEPHLQGWVRQASREGFTRVPLESRRLVALAGVSTHLGRWASGSGLSATVRGGQLSDEDTAATWFGTRVVGDFEYAAASADVAQSQDAAEREVLARIRLGSLRRFALHGHVEGTQGQSGFARYVTREDHDALPFAPLEGSGWSTGGGATLAWAQWLSSAAQVDADLMSGRLLGVGGVTAYRHRCDCLAVAAAGGRRIGRGGVDVMVTVDLMP